MKDLILLAGLVGFVSGYIFRGVVFMWRLRRKLRAVSTEYKQRRRLNELGLDPAFDPQPGKLRGAAAQYLRLYEKGDGSGGAMRWEEN